MTLALDSTTAAGSLAVARGTEVILARRGDASRPHGARLPGDALALLEDAGVALSEVTLFAVASGPGAFTGLRIGIAAVQGLAFAQGRPVVGVSALDALAESALRAGPLPAGTRVGAWMDAARQEVFTALYEVSTAGAPATPTMRELDAPAVQSAAACLARWAVSIDGERLAFVGDGALRYRALIETAGRPFRLIESWPPLAAAMVPLALDAAARGRAGPPHAIRPLYIRRPDAEIARDRRAEQGGDA